MHTFLIKPERSGSRGKRHFCWNSSFCCRMTSPHMQLWWRACTSPAGSVWGVAPTAGRSPRGSASYLQVCWGNYSGSLFWCLKLNSRPMKTSHHQSPFVLTWRGNAAQTCSAFRHEPAAVHQPSFGSSQTELSQNSSGPEAESTSGKTHRHESEPDRNVPDV